MTNLKEEIYNLLDESARVKAGYYTDKIIELIELRIDGLEDSYERHRVSALQLTPFHVFDDIRDYMGLKKDDNKK